jgi:hypothetical protein
VLLSWGYFLCALFFLLNSAPDEDATRSCYAGDYGCDSKSVLTYVEKPKSPASYEHREYKSKDDSPPLVSRIGMDNLFLQILTVKLLLLCHRHYSLSTVWDYLAILTEDVRRRKRSSETRLNKEFLDALFNALSEAIFASFGGQWK